MNKKTPKKSLFRFFEPIDVDDFVSINGTSDDITESLGRLSFSTKTVKLFLNRFSIDGIMNIMNKVGLIKHLHRKGFKHLLPEVDMDESGVHYLKLYNKIISPESLLIDLRISESRFVPEAGFFEQGRALNTLDMVIIEWLSCQNPDMRFLEGKPQLPGQKKPGLGALKYLMRMMYLVAKEVIKDGFMDVPDHMHGAVMYSKNFYFFNPSHEGVLRALTRDMKGYSLVDVSWGMLTKTIVDEATGEPQQYRPSEQISPVSRRLKDYFNSRKYRRTFKSTYRIKKFIFEYDKMLKLKEEILRSRDVADI